MVDKAEDDKTPAAGERERNMDSRINPNPKQEVCGMLRWTIFQPVASDPLYGDAHTHTHTQIQSGSVRQTCSIQTSQTMTTITKAPHSCKTIPSVTLQPLSSSKDDLSPLKIKEDFVSVCQCASNLISQNKYH